jgi:ribosomal protein S14
MVVPMKKNTGVYTVYNGMIPKMRTNGSTLQEIGNRCGVTRERIRQVLNKYYPDNLHASAFTTEHLARELEISRYCVRSLCNQLGIKPLRAPREHGKLVLWDKKALPKLRIAHTCQICGKPIPKGRRYYCSQQCQIQTAKYKYRPPKYKREHSLAVRRWQKEHPEIVKASAKKAQRKYQDKVLANCKYLIIKKCAIPLNTVVQNAGRKTARKIPVEWEGRIYYLSAFQLRKARC